MIDITQAGNGKNEDPQIEKVFEPLDEERWVDLDFQTGRREIAFSEEMREEIEIDEDSESESN